MRVLVTNDDGIEAEGLIALEKALAGAGTEVIVVAPDEERSASSHSVSLRKPIRLKERTRNRFAICGTPVDTVHIAINHLLKNRMPDLVVSGINRGANLGCDIHYSGTVGAAREASILGLRSLAVSLDTVNPHPDFGYAANMAVDMAKLVFENGLPPRTILNMNLPDLSPEKIKGIKVTRQGVRKYDSMIQENEDKNGDTCYMLSGGVIGGEPIPESDIVAVEQGYISITPLRLDLTNDCVIEWLKERIP